MKMGRLQLSTASRKQKEQAFGVFGRDVGLSARVRCFTPSRKAAKPQGRKEDKKKDYQPPVCMPV
jgi:hypothetical protein